ncbi:TerC family protein [Paenibacillus thalictri]|uniref:TerC family protein n=1 Tax=Paenibacillus thalictri TaxID=2527873 RepID=A0A4Q9DP90_9BACL|nr:TerC family protein [Paenibacillus thalictri]TBL78115.1 TerC family protein [Paenibacillus thalictri]
MLDWFLLFLQIMLINIVLSGDNAVVIAMASKKLPISQRNKAIWWGAFGAVGLRLILTVVAVYVLSVPYIQAAGSLLLLWIAVKLLIDDDSHANVKEASTLGGAVWTIIVADFVMSLDNVLAIAAKADNDLLVIILGIGLSIPIIVWGSTLVMNLLNKYPILIYIGAGILGYTAGEMFMKDHAVVDFLFGNSEMVHWMIPAVTTIAVVLIGVLKRLASRKAKHA